MIGAIRRRFALWRMSRRIEATLDQYGTIEQMLISQAQEDLARMVELRRNSPEIVEYRKRRAAVLSSRPRKMPTVAEIMADISQRYPSTLARLAESERCEIADGVNQTSIVSP